MRHSSVAKRFYDAQLGVDMLKKRAFNRRGEPSRAGVRYHIAASRVRSIDDSKEAPILNGMINT